MTIKTTGAISISDIITELSLGNNTLKSLNDADIRSLLGKASGMISLGDAYGKTAVSAGIGGTFVIGDGYTVAGLGGYGWISAKCTYNVDTIGILIVDGLSTASVPYFVDPNGVKIYSFNCQQINTGIWGHYVRSDIKVASIKMYLSVPGYPKTLFTFNYLRDVYISDAYIVNNYPVQARYEYVCNTLTYFAINAIGQTVGVAFS